MKKNSIKRYFVGSISIITVAATLLTGCGSRKVSKEDLTSIKQVENKTSTTSEIEVDKEFTANDLDVGYEDSTATHITLEGSNFIIDGDGTKAKGSVLTISSEGTYVFRGTLSDGQIVVDAGDSDKVHIVLNGASITCLDNAPIYIKNADKTFITLVDETQNSLTDGSEYVQTDDKNVDAVIFSAADLTINGDGILNINANYKHGVASKDDLVITGGNYNITAVKDALNGKDCVKIKDGTFNLNVANGNGIQSKNDDDSTKGYVYICGGNINVTNCKEGIEGTVIIIDEGTIQITAEDDGLNSASANTSTSDDATIINMDKPDMKDENADTTKSDSHTMQGKEASRGLGRGDNPFEVDSNCYISISGGTITIDAAGDGIDTNGHLFISGGTIYVNGPTNSGNGGLDYNGTAEISGGTVIVTGSAGMAQGFSDTSTQYSFLYNLTSVCEAGTEVKLTDNSGNVIVSYTPSKQYQSVVISTPELTKDATYTLTCGNQTADITLSSVVTSNGPSGMGGHGKGGPGMNGRGKTEDEVNPPQGMPNDNGTGDMTPPDGGQPNLENTENSPL